MIIYSGTKEQFRSDVMSNDIENIVYDAYKQATGRSTGRSEISSWKNSLQYMDRVLEDEGIPSDTGVAIEYRIPQSAKRIDFILTGADSEGREVAVLAELKQWQEAELTDKDGIVRTFISGGMREVTHPSYQVWTYKRLLEDFNQSVQEDDIQLYPCAYLHNYADEAGKKKKVITNDFYEEHISNAPVFLKSDAGKLQEFIKAHIKRGDKCELMYRIDKGKIRPSKHLADELVSMLKGNQSFVMVDDQKLVYQSAIRMAEKASETGTKTIMIVDGAAGTGKSVVAINLLVELTKKGLVAKYVTRNSAPRLVYEAKLTGSMRRSHIANMFSGSGSYHSAEKDVFGCLIVDEAHRLNEKSGMFQNLGENQVKEIIQASKSAVFFIDEDQRVTLKDIGTKDEIKRWAKKQKAKVIEYSLESQFRCNGSNGYLAWLDNTLQVRDTANDSLNGSGYDFRMIDNPAELHAMIRRKNKEANKSRVVAGYCWKWISKKTPALRDIVIGGYGATWNLTAHGQAWIIQPDSVSEVGCIHTCQGLELDYVGVIIGPDLIVRDGKVITQPDQRATSDRSISGWKKLMKKNPEKAQEQLDMIIKNTYRTLMTRGQKGCYVYCTDKETQEYFRDCMGMQDQVSEEASSSMSLMAEPEGKEFIECLPVYSLEIAAGLFAKPSVSECLGWVKTPEGIKASKDHFVAQVTGKSMEPMISDGSYCVFRFGLAGSRNGKIVLAQLSQASDPETGGSYTVKLYKSKKAVKQDGEWEHSSIQLLPLNRDYQPIVITPDDAESTKIVAEYISPL
jgi:uncharacterized protein